MGPQSGECFYLCCVLTRKIVHTLGAAGSHIASAPEVVLRARFFLCQITSTESLKY